MAKATLKKPEAKPAQSEDKSNYYASLSPKLRKEAALEMAQEILAHDHQISILAMAIQNYIDPYQGGSPMPKEEDAEITLDSAKQLLALLVDKISNVGQLSRLLKCIEAI